MFRRSLPALLSAALALPAIAASPGNAPDDRFPEQARAAQQVGDEPVEAPAEQPRVVVAAIDSGINPYHEAFQVADPVVDEHVLEAFGIDDDHVLRVSDDYDADVASGVYEGVAERELYWFEGTNILAWSSSFGDRPLLPDDSGDTHGTGVTGAVLAANPDAIVLFVEGIGSASEEFAFTHSEVDIVTTSYGFATSAPLGALAGSHQGVVELGKLHFGAAANDPTLAPTDGTAGPWWAIGVAGFGEGEDGGAGKETLSGTAPDVVGDFTQELPYCDICTEGTESVSGTSFATPRTAGTASAIILELRRQHGHLGGISNGLLVDTEDFALSNWQFRRALEEGAAVPEFVAPAGVTEQPVNPVAPYLHVGWGLVSPDPAYGVIDRTLTFIETQSPTKSAETCDYMTTYMTLRTASWDVNPLSDTFGETNALEGSPYIAC